MISPSVEWLNEKFVQKQEYLFGSDDQCLCPSDIACVPAHPHLVVITMEGTHQVQVYDMHKKKLLCTKDLRRSNGECFDGDDLCSPTSVVVTQDALHVVVADSDKNRLIILSLDIHAGTASPNVTLTWLSAFGQEMLKYPSGLALCTVNERLTVLVAERWGHRVSEWNIDGARVRTVCGTGHTGSDEGQLTHPSDVVVLPQCGHIVVADIDNHRISVFRYCGCFLYSFGQTTLFHPCALAVDSQDHILVLDHKKDLRVYDTQGELVYTEEAVCFAGRKGIEWTECEDGRLYIAHYDEDEVDVCCLPPPVERDDATEKIEGQAQRDEERQ